MEQNQWNIYKIEHDSESCLETYINQQDEVPCFFCDSTNIANDTLTIKQVKLKDLQISSHYLSKQTIGNIEPLPINNGEASWIFFTTLFIIGLFIINLFTSLSKFKNAIRGGFSNREASIFSRNYDYHSIQVITTYAIVSALLSMQTILIIKYNFTNNIGLREFIIINAFFYVYFFIKQLAISLSGKLFDTVEESRQYLYRDYFSKTTAITILLPFIFAAEFSHSPEFFLNISIVITILTIIHKTILAFFIGYSNSKYGLFYFILYFCTIEIMPLLIIVKALFSLGLIA